MLGKLNRSLQINTCVATLQFPVKQKPSRLPRPETRNLSNSFMRCTSAGSNSLCLRMLSNVAEAEDLTQEAFLQLYRKIGTFRGDSAFSTWLHRLAVNVVLMHLRKKGCLRSRSKNA